VLRLSSLFILLVVVGHSYGQEYIWLENEVSIKTENFYIEKDNRTFHSTVKPYSLNDSIKEIIYGAAKLNTTLKQKSKNAGISIFPLVNASTGVSIEDSTFAIGQLGIGLALESYLGEKLTFSISAYFEGGTYPTYVSDYINYRGVVPGMGRAFPGILDYNITRIDALLAYRPFDFLCLETGVGKQFIGDGYRSFFVSDIASNNPFGRLNVNIWHLNFSATYSSLTHLQPNTGPDWQMYGKYTARHYLSWNATKSLRVGFFESVVWQASDSSYYRGFDASYANPIQFYRPVEYSIGSADNSLLGVDITWAIKQKWKLYSQFILDEFLLRELSAGDGWWANKYAWQLGLKVFEPFSSKDLFLRLEFNLARPFTFTHGSPKQNYAQMGEPIGHTLGTNFYEGLIEVDFKVGKYGRIQNLLIGYIRGEDPIGENLGGNIFEPYSNPTYTYGNYIAQGNQRIVALYNVQYSYLLSSENRLKLIAGLQFRGQRYLDVTTFSTQVFVGFSTAIWNRNYAF
jgi:hypothetical protein